MLNLYKYGEADKALDILEATFDLSRIDLMVRNGFDREAYLRAIKAHKEDDIAVEHPFNYISKSEMTLVEHTIERLDAIQDAAEKILQKSFFYTTYCLHVPKGHTWKQEWRSAIYDCYGMLVKTFVGESCSDVSAQAVHYAKRRGCNVEEF